MTQWLRPSNNDGTHTITLPTAMRNTNYVVLATYNIADTGNHYSYAIKVHSKNINNIKIWINTYVFIMCIG